MDSEFLDFLTLLLQQFSGGPGSPANNLVRFGLPAMFLGVLTGVAWSRQRQHQTPREKWLVWGFGLGFVREFYMFIHVATRIISETEHDLLCSFSEPFEHALDLAAMVVIAGAFIRYLSRDSRLARRFLWLGLGATALSYLSTFWGWAQTLFANPLIRFHETWYAWPFHVVSIVLLAIAIALMLKQKGWLRNVVVLALFLFLLSESVVLFNYATDRAYRHLVCPAGNLFHMLAIPLLGYVYLREQSIARQRVEDELRAYRDQLEGLVQKRTAELTTTNKNLQESILERIQAEVALEKLGRQNELILQAAGEGIFGVDIHGNHTFVNPAAARMLGVSPTELIGKPSHPTWHHSKPDGSSYPEDECPLHNGYKSGAVCRGDSEWFWRSDGSCFPVEYICTPVQEGDELTGAVVVFQDITQRKQAEIEIAQRNAELAGQNAIAAAISQSLDLDTVLQTALDKVMDILQMDTGRIFLLESDEKTMTLRVQRGNGAAVNSEDGALQLPMTEGISGIAMARSQPVIMRLAELSKKRPDDFSDQNLQLLVSTPLVSKGWVIGALTLGSQRLMDITEQEMNLLASIGQQIGMAVENAHLYRQTEHWAHAMAQLHQAGVLLTSSLETNTIYDQITKQAARLLDCDLALLFLWDRENEQAVGFSSNHGNGARVRDLRLEPEKHVILNDLISLRRPVAIKDYSADPRAIVQLKEEYGVKSKLALPLQVHGRLLGFLFLIDQTSPRIWRSEEIDWAASLVNNASIALENALLYEKVEQAAALEERQRIAAEIHDGLAQTLGFLGLAADQVIELVTADNKTDTIVGLQHMRQVIGKASTEVRESIASLQESSESLRPLQRWLEQLVTEFSQGIDLVIQFENTIENPLILPAAELEQVRRVVQEALLNAIRHANADLITIRLQEMEGKAVVSVEDDGHGFDPQAPETDSRMRFGLSIMRARAARLKGAIQIHTAPGQGTQVILSWPLSVTTFTMSAPL